MTVVDPGNLVAGSLGFRIEGGQTVLTISVIKPPAGSERSVNG